MALLIGLGLGVGSAILGAFGGAQQQDQQRSAEQQRIENQYQYDTKQYDFNWEQELRKYQYLVEGNKISTAQEETLARLKDQLALDQYNHDLAIRNYEYQNQLKQYNESERIYKKQVSFNKLAAENAVAAENRKLQETVMSAAFDNQDMVVELLQQEGLAQARGVSGKSMKKQLNMQLAQFGRNQAAMAESLVSAKHQAGVNLRDLDQQLYAANLQAEANRMIAPTIRPDIPVPYRTPRPILQDPLKPAKGPAPIKGTNTVPQSSGLSIASGIMGGVVSGISTYKSLAPQQSTG